MGGLIEITCASAGRTILATAGSGLLAPFAGGPNLVLGMAGPAGAAAPRTLRISPRLANSVRLGSEGRGGNLGVGFSGNLAPGFGGKLMNPTLSPTLGPIGGGGGGGRAEGGGVGVIGFSATG